MHILWSKSVKVQFTFIKFMAVDTALWPNGSACHSNARDPRIEPSKGFIFCRSVETFEKLKMKFKRINIKDSLEQRPLWPRVKIFCYGQNLLGSNHAGIN